MSENTQNIDKLIKKHNFKSIDDLKNQDIRVINQFMEKTNLSYFEVFFESEIEDIREHILNDDIRIIKVKNGTKRPQDNDFFNKRLTLKEILNHNGNFGVAVGYNHIKGKSLACIDIDGFKIPKLTKAQKQILSDDQVELLETLTEERKEEIVQESKDYLLACIFSGLPNAMAVKTQSGGYHIYMWNRTHLNQELEDIFHYVSKRLVFPKDCPIKEIRGLSLLNSIEIFTTFESKQCVLAGSFTKNFKAKETHFYKIMDIDGNTRTLGNLGVVNDINEAVKKQLLSIGFEWVDEPVQDIEIETRPAKVKTKKTKERILNPVGILKDLTEEEIDEIVEILLPIFINKNLEGVGHYTILALGGYFCHTITEESGVQIVARLLTKAKYGADNVKEGIKTLKENYHRKGRKTGLNTAFANIQDKLGLTNDERETLKKQLQSICYPTMNKTNKTPQDLKILIKQSLCLNKDPALKLLADYVNGQDSFFIDYETGNKYKKTDKGFEEITVQDISLLLNDDFGENEISIKKCEQVMSYITNPIKTDYDLIIFNNGTLNTKDGTFEQDFFPLDRLPKIKTSLNYIENAEAQFKETALYKEFQSILNNKKWAWNEQLYYKAVGVSAMAINESDCFFVIVGVPNARKTTILTPLKRFFTFSEVKIQTIAKNERFQILPCIRKDINIDDDLSDTLITNSGFFKTFISGAGGNVERKGENIFATLTAETTPIIWGASNKLPTIHGEGIERRTCLLLAENPIDPAEAKKGYQRDILEGLRDDEVELMISYSIQYYMSLRDKPFLTEEQQKEMLKEWDWKSYPAKMGASLVFMDTDKYIEYLEGLQDEGKIKNVKYNERDNTISYEAPFKDGKMWNKVERETWTPVYKVNKEFKKFHKESLKSGKIFRELSNPSAKLITQAMSNAGFFQAKKTITDDYGHKEQVRVYEDCIINPDWEKELKL